MSGLYIHIPFCSRRCHYCDFYFVTNGKHAEDYVGAALREMTHRAEGGSLKTIYFGGGTPSMLPAIYIQRLLDHARQLWQVETEVEITLEANPEDINLEKLQAWREAGVNRLSIGLQSFDNRWLQWMNRTHTAEDSIRSVELAAQTGFEQINIDLIYGLPGMEDSEWEAALRKAASLPVNHLSTYALTVEPRTRLNHLIRKKIYTAPESEDQARQYMMLMELAPDLGFEQYEISNFAKEGHYSKHNSAYWNYVPYIGIGPSAHSFDGVNRYHHPSRLSLYLQNPLQPEREELNALERYNEYVYISLRLNRGIIYTDFVARFGEAALQELKEQSQLFAAEGLLELYTEGIRLTNAGRVQADRIAMELFKI